VPCFAADARDKLAFWGLEWVEGAVLLLLVFGFVGERGGGRGVFLVLWSVRGKVWNERGE
jgi:hypothetical protein